MLKRNKKKKRNLKKGAGEALLTPIPTPDVDILKKRDTGLVKGVSVRFLVRVSKETFDIPVEEDTAAKDLERSVRETLGGVIMEIPSIDDEPTESRKSGSDIDQIRP